MTKVKDGQKIPSKEFLAMVIILLRKAEAETGTSFVDWLESFEENDDTMTVETYDNKSLRIAIAKMLREEYPDPPAPINPADWVDEEDEAVPEPETEDDPHANTPEAEIVPPEADDDGPAPEVQRLD